MSDNNYRKQCAVGITPPDWGIFRAKFLFRERKELSTDGSEELLSASHITGVTRRADKDVGMFLAESHEGYKIVHSGDVVVNTMWAWMGAIGISTLDGLISPSYGVYRVISEEVNGRFYDYLLRSKPFVAEVNRRSKGVWSSRLRLYPTEFLDLRLPVPPRDMQRAIADFLDRETARIDRLVRLKEESLMCASLRIEALVDRGMSNSSVPWVRFENVAQRVYRPVQLSLFDELVPLGLYNRGRGIFRKPASDEEGMGESDFYFVKPGDLILSGQFAWEGAVALAGDTEEGCVVSHRYPIYRGRQEVSSAYLLGMLRSSYGDFLLNEASRGAAGRNRPLNTWRLGKEKIPIPDKADQLEVAKAVDFEQRLRVKTGTSITRLEEFRAALITAAVTGQIDVETWGKRGGTDRRLEQIEEAMRA